MKVFLLVSAGNEDVIDVGIGTLETISNVVDEMLEGLSSISKFEWHPGELEQPEQWCHGCFTYVLRSNWNLVECSDLIQLGEMVMP